LFWSLCYLVFGCVLQLVSLRPRSDDFKELEIVVLRHELSVLRRQTRRPQLTATDRVFLAAASQLLPRSSWRSFLVTPATFPAALPPDLLPALIKNHGAQETDPR
jgi:putative transposase